MGVAAKLVLSSGQWDLRKIYVTTAAIISFLIICAPSLYNSNFLILPALGLLAILLITGTFASVLCFKNLLRRQWRRSTAWLLLAGLSFAGWWVSYKISAEAMNYPLAPDDPALGDLLHRAFAPYFSS